MHDINPCIARLISYCKVYYFLCYTEKICKISLESVLIFVTGLSSIPAVGFYPQPTVSFAHDLITASVGPDYVTKYPLASTCDNVIRLPTCHDSYEEFKTHVIEGIMMSECCD